MRALIAAVVLAGSLPLLAQTPYLVKDINPTPAAGSNPTRFVAAGDQLFFQAWDGTGTVTDPSNLPLSLWRTDGTSEGTIKLIDFAPGDAVAVGRSIFFTRSGTLWTSDGTPEGTVPATSFTSRFPSVPSIRYVAGDTIFASVSVPGTAQLWSASTAPGAPAVALGSENGFRFGTVAGRTYYFLAPSDVPFWTSDGTPAGTYAVSAALNSGAPKVDPVTLGGHLYFVAHNGGSPQLWRSDGSADGTMAIKALPSLVDQLVASDDKLFFNVDHALWLSDGTDTRAATTATIFNYTPFAVIGDRAVFAHGDGGDFEPWVTDGTATGTFRLRDISPGSLGSFPRDFLAVDGLIYFTAPGSQAFGLWATDGTPEGTRLVGNGLSPQTLVRAGQHLFFSGSDSATGRELWALPLTPSPRLSIEDVRLPEGDSGTSSARFTVTLSPPSTQTVTAEFATADGTAVAGSDYDTASGTVTFAPGETSKTIVVPVRGDVATENNETFWVHLRNAAGAAFARSSAAAVIEDDDQLADVSLKADFSPFSSAFVDVTASNSGPRTATNIKIRRTATPTSFMCFSDCSRLVQLAPGATGKVLTDTGVTTGQGFITITATARERDPQPANNSVAWTVNENMAMDALYLTPGASANVWLRVLIAAPNITLDSSNPAVVSVPPSVSAPSTDKPVTFVAHAVGLGRATIRARVFREGTFTLEYGTLTIDVVAPGTKVRFPGALSVFGNGGSIPFDTKFNLTIETGGTAPYTGELATGLVTVTSGTGELARMTLPSKAFDSLLSFYLPQIGPNALTVNYEGDANFLPLILPVTLTAKPGLVTMNLTGEKSGTSGTLHVRVAGSPVAAPGGTIEVSEGGHVLASNVALVASGTAGVTQADIALAGLAAGANTLVITYSGDARYALSRQNFRLGLVRQRSARH